MAFLLLARLPVRPLPELRLSIQVCLQVFVPICLPVHFLFHDLVDYFAQGVVALSPIFQDLFLFTAPENYLFPALLFGFGGKGFGNTFRDDLSNFVVSVGSIPSILLITVNNIL